MYAKYRKQVFAHVPLYPITNPECLDSRSTWKDCRFDRNRITSEFIERLRRVVASFQAHEVQPCLILLDTAWYHYAENKNQHPWTDIFSLNGSAQVNAMLSAFAHILQKIKNENIPLRCFEAINEPQDSGKIFPDPLDPHSVDPVITELNRCLKYPSSPGCSAFPNFAYPITVLVDDTYKSPSNPKDPCYDAHLAENADFFMLHSADLVSTGSRPLCEVKACMRNVRDALGGGARRIVISDDGSYASTYEPNYMKFFFMTYYGDFIDTDGNGTPDTPPHLEFHFHKLGIPPKPGQEKWGNEAWTPSYWLTVLTEKLPQWPAAEDVARLIRNPDGSPKPPQATIRFCANPYEWQSCVDDTEPISISECHPRTFFWTGWHYSPQKCRILRNNTAVINATCTDREPVPGDSPGTYIYTISCSESRQNDVQLNVTDVEEKVDLKVNGDDGPVYVLKGANVNLTWTIEGCDMTCSLKKNAAQIASDIPFVGNHIEMDIKFDTRFEIVCVKSSKIVARDYVDVRVSQPFLKVYVEGAYKETKVPGEQLVKFKVLENTSYVISWESAFMASCSVSRDGEANWSDKVEGSKADVADTIHRYTFTCYDIMNLDQYILHVNVVPVECLEHIDCAPFEQCLPTNECFYFGG